MNRGNESRLKPLLLYGYWRSSASYRVRIALHLKQVPFEYRAVDLVKDGGEQNQPAYRALNPQGRVPLLVDGGFRLGQSLAILDYLEAKYPRPSLVPAHPEERARMWAFCHTIAADIQPLQNAGPLKYLVTELRLTEGQRDGWARHWIQRGLEALEQELGDRTPGPCVFGETPTLADCLLVPQVYNADRYGCDRSRFPRLHALAGSLATRPAFAAAHPNVQPDAPR